jgi:hypothetical protein
MSLIRYVHVWVKLAIPHRIFSLQEQCMSLDTACTICREAACNDQNMQREINESEPAWQSLHSYHLQRPARESAFSALAPSVTPVNFECIHPHLSVSSTSPIWSSGVYSIFRLRPVISGLIVHNSDCRCDNRVRRVKPPAFRFEAINS